MASKEEEQFEALNRRRIQLIKKEYDDGLSVDEEVELAELQELADQHTKGLMAIDPERLRELWQKYAEITEGAESPAE